MKNLLNILIVIALTVNSNTSIYAKVWRVNKNPGYNDWTNTQVFDDLNTAINAAGNDDTLYVEGSPINYGSVTINKPLTIIGTGYLLNQNLNLQNYQESSKVTGIIFGPNSSGSTVMGIERIVGAGVGFQLSNNPLSNIIITRCLINQGVDFANALGTIYNNIVISKCILPGIQTGLGPVNGLMVFNNYFTSNLTVWSNCHGEVGQNVIQGDLNIYGIQFYNNIVLGNSVYQNSNADSNIYNNIIKSFIS